MMATHLEVAPAGGGLFKIVFTQRYIGPGFPGPVETYELGTKHRCVFGDRALFTCEENPLESRDHFNAYVTLTHEMRERLELGVPRPIFYEEFVVTAFTESTRALARTGSNLVDREGHLRQVFLKGDCQSVP